VFPEPLFPVFPEPLNREPLNLIYGKTSRFGQKDAGLPQKVALFMDLGHALTFPELPETLVHPCPNVSGRPERLVHHCPNVSGRPERLVHPCPNVSGTFLTIGTAVKCL
jgi:hypothetical protein